MVAELMTLETRQTRDALLLLRSNEPSSTSGAKSWTGGTSPSMDLDNISTSSSGSIGAVSHHGARYVKSMRTGRAKF